MSFSENVVFTDEALCFSEKVEYFVRILIIILENLSILMKIIVFCTEKASPLGETICF